MLKRLILVLCLALAAFAQEPQAPAKPEPVPPPQVQSQAKTQPQATMTVEHRMTKAEAEELFRSVDEILAFVSRDTGLPIKHTVKRKMVSRDEVEKFLNKRMDEDEDRQRLEKSSVTLKKLGLLPRNFDLGPFLVALLKEQVAGYYDPKTKTVNLLDWIDAESQKSVLAHELTHALQDQNYDMLKWMGDDKKKPKTAQEQFDEDEQHNARQAVLEGQAMISLMDYMMAPQGVRITDVPQLADAMRSGMTAEVPNSPTFSKAPLFLRETMIFPYSQGLDFELKVLLKRGTGPAFTGVLQKPPVTTRQIMEPDTYMAGEVIKPLPVADIDAALGKQFVRHDEGGIGEFDIYEMVKDWINLRSAEAISPAWRGAYYFTYRPKGQEKSNVPVSLVWMSRWQSPEKARQFADLYGQGIAKRYQKAQLKKGLAEDGTAEWTTEEGPVYMTLKGDLVFVSESMDEEAMQRAKEAAFKAVEGK